MDVLGIYNDKYSSFATLPYYRNEYDFFGHQLEKLFRYHSHINPASKKVIDLGCGFGMKTHILKQHCASVKGVDFIENIVKVNNLLSGDPNLSFEVMNLLQPLPGSETFDMAFAFGLSLFNTSNIEEYINQTIRLKARFVKPNGQLVLWSFTDFSGLSPSGWYNHTKPGLSKIKAALLEEHRLQTELFFPYRKMDKNDVTPGKLLKSLAKYIRPKQYYFTIIY
ncbi:MAG: class I SAM-dependent methyltransferase [Saprospiraceae bacterium]|nr:class I SAM-dependent methyltransferase [Saprospiraceae bacterium]